MPREHLIYCSEGIERRGEARHGVRLAIHGPAANVRLRIADISRRLVATIPDVLTDLLDVAAYIYAADSAVSRGGKADQQFGARWRRTFRLSIPVRLPSLWSSAAVSSALIETLTFLSDDKYAIEFRPLDSPPTAETYFDFRAEGEAAFHADAIVLFSGGLDSLAGVVDILANSTKSVALVSHRSASKIAGTQRDLVAALRDRFGASRILHVPVWMTLDEQLTKEVTHRTRSFLFAALGAVTARLFGRDQVQFFENGVVSLNFPIAGQVVGARATRTTHPLALVGFHRIFSALLGQPFHLDNPFIWVTKTEVVARIAGHACGDFIKGTRSCTRVYEMTRLHPHCGRCSQCLDRRFAVLAAGQESEDPEESYNVDLFTGRRSRGPDREMALAYVRTATEIRRMDEDAFFAHFGEISRVVGQFDEPADRVAARICDLYRRHAASVCDVFDSAISAHRTAIREGALPADSLLALVIGRQERPEHSISPSEAQAIETHDEPIVRVALDEAERQVRFERWGVLKDVGADLLIALAESFREATAQERAPENFPFVCGKSLQRLIGCGDDEALRARISRCRRAIATLARKAGDTFNNTDNIIETVPWRGYRLNPNRVRIVALGELRPGA